jgi:hypothetical protein
VKAWYKETLKVLPIDVALDIFAKKVTAGWLSALRVLQI